MRTDGNVAFCIAGRAGQRRIGMLQYVTVIAFITEKSCAHFFPSICCCCHNPTAMVLNYLSRRLLCTEYNPKTPNPVRVMGHHINFPCTPRSCGDLTPSPVLRCRYPYITKPVAQKGAERVQNCMRARLGQFIHFPTRNSANQKQNNKPKKTGKQTPNNKTSPHAVIAFRG